MSDIMTFVNNNIWLCVGVGAIVVILADEFLGVTRAFMSDPTDNLSYDKRIREKTPPKAPEDPLDGLDEKEDGPSVEDMLRRK